MPTIRESLDFDKLTVEDLTDRRRRLTEKARAAGGHQGLKEEELIEWLECTRQLRRRHAGPKKEKASRSAPTAADL